MSNIAQQRIQREFREVVKSKEIAESGVQLELVSIGRAGECSLSWCAQLELVSVGRAGEHSLSW